MSAQLDDWEEQLLSTRPQVSFDVLPERPVEPQTGDVWWQPIDELLNHWSSFDGASPEYWEGVLEGKREDYHYKDVVAEIRENGFTRPVTCTYPGRYYRDEERAKLYYGDGHHRLAACIDLGYSHIPIELTTWNDLISPDSGGWSRR